MGLSGAGSIVAPAHECSRRRKGGIAVKSPRMGSPKMNKKALRTLKPTDELDWVKICEELKTSLNSDGRRALVKLAAAGCGEREILQNLYLFCGGNPYEMRKLRKDLDFPRTKKKVLKIARLLFDATSEIPVAERLLRDLGLSTWNIIPETSKIEQFAVLLSRVGETAYSQLASQKVSGRDQHLVYLCALIKVRTGRLHYAEVADLVNAIQLAYRPGSLEIATERSIRARVSYHRPPDLGSALELMKIKDPEQT
jgi:hypothetical protein